jgi:hypothetical protein
MKYLHEILSLLSWPVLIYVTYRVVLFALKKFDEKRAGAEQ